MGKLTEIGIGLAGGVVMGIVTSPLFLGVDYLLNDLRSSERYVIQEKKDFEVLENAYQRLETSAVKEVLDLRSRTPFGVDHSLIHGTPNEQHQAYHLVAPMGYRTCEGVRTHGESEGGLKGNFNEKEVFDFELSHMRVTLFDDTIIGPPINRDYMPNKPLIKSGEKNSTAHYFYVELGGIRSPLERAIDEYLENNPDSPYNRN